MPMPNPKRSSDQSGLDPVERASEVVFGTLMAMSFTGTLSVATAGEQDIHTMMLAAIGCNLAWGLTDAVMYLITEITERERKISFLHKLHHAESAEAADKLIADEMPERLRSHANPAVFEAFRKSLVELPEPRAILGRRQYLDGLWVFLLVAFSTFPIVLPFLLVDEAVQALRLSNALGVLTLFVSGTVLGRRAGGKGWHFGLAMAAIGSALVGIIILLGG
jgi:VIT1/CCC1 family predicted Fe2+/Mn2+ transporter